MRFALVFDDPKSQGSYIPQVESQLIQVGEVTQITSEEIMEGGLNGFDAVVFPGGLAAYYGLKKWGDQFGHAIRYFVAAGGGYLGVCGGAYIASRYGSFIFQTYCNRSLNLIDCAVKPPDWMATLATYVATEGERFAEFIDIADVDNPIIWGHQGELIEIIYSGGPGFDSIGETVTPLAWYHEPEWKGQAAIVATTFGQGRVVLCGPHPETPFGEELVGEPSVPWLYPNMARWVAEKELSPSYAVTPWEKSLAMPSALPVILGAGTFGLGVVMIKKAGK